MLNLLWLMSILVQVMMAVLLMLLAIHLLWMWLGLMQLEWMVL